ncbi:MAG: serine/threonine protein kinase [bacterium]|nr:serine/threonine protein kinase [bacterium]
MVGRTLSHYQIVEKIGEGGMGVVYKAWDTRLERPVAVKVLATERTADPDRKRRFVQEAKTASSLNHPNIITIYDIGNEDGVDFIAMEFVAGQTLEQVIPPKGMRLSYALHCAEQIADALATAHMAAIVHRDLKPGNVMVTDRGRVKVLDFGLAKLTESISTPVGEHQDTLTIHIDSTPRTEHGAVMGTVAYMSPEQVEGRKVDGRSDIFSFGSLLYEMVTGQRAFQGKSRAATMAAVVEEEPPPLRKAVPRVPADLETTINRCLRKDVNRRMQHMADVRVALTDAKEMWDSGPSERAAAVRRPRLSRRTAWIAVAALAGLLLGLLAGTRRGEPLAAAAVLSPVTSGEALAVSPS